MEFLTIIYASVYNFALYAAAFVLALTIIVFIHEYGHFQVARWCGVEVEVFSIGFGKEIVGRYDRHGTRWKVCWIPLGGYVKFKGDANAASLPSSDAIANARSNPGHFHGKPVWQRAAVVAAGPAANFVLAIFIFTAAFMTVGAPVSEPRVDELLPGSAAEKAGIQTGDMIVEIEGRQIETFDDLIKSVVARGGDELRIVVSRAGQRIDLSLVPDIVEEPDGKGGVTRRGLLGVKHNNAAGMAFERMGPADALREGVENTWFIVDTTFRYLGKLFTGRESADQLGGPISIAQAAGDAATAGPYTFITMIAFLSVSIGLINLFPIPMLDGGHLVYYALEALRGKPLGENAQEWGFRIGFSLVIMLMLVGTWNDILRKINQFFGG